MKKTGIINRVHKGLRVWLFEVGTRVQQTDFTNALQGRQTISEILQVLKSLERKSFLEEHYYLPALSLQAPYVLLLLEEENKQLGELSAKLKRNLENYLQPGTEGHYRASGLSIQQNYMEFLSHLLIYMNRQESLFYGLGSQDGVTESANLLSLAEDHRMEFFVWILKGMNNREISEWLESDTEGSLAWKRNVLGTLSPQRLQEAGLDLHLMVKGSMVAA